jgi:hypothetical protein
MLQRGVSMVDHYLDGFITMGPPNLDLCRNNLELILAVCRDLGVPLAIEKLEGPSQCLTFLGIEIDTASSQLRLPVDELALLKALLAQLAARRSCQRHHLESLLAPCSMLAEWLGQGEHSSDALLTCSGF